MERLKSLVESIEKKIGDLILYKRNSEITIRNLQEDKLRLSSEVKKSQEQINELKEQIKILKLGQVVNSSSDTTEVKLKINNLVKKIDKCIGHITSQQ
ncbi:MAG: hypothetical protein LBM25_08210 [Bacteroidales bacterium]|jgi:hypothetical protein|nr:hypothetical protein [Bacteroidales bacterium]